MLARRLRGLAELAPGRVADGVRRSPVLAPAAEPVFAALARPWHGRTVAVRGGPAAGLRLRVDRRSAIWLSGRVERPVQDALAGALRPGHVFYDVGASVGFFSLLGARLVGDGTVVAFEPDPDAVAALRANAALNGLANVLAVPAAASDRAGRATLEVSARAPGRIPGGGAAARPGARQVPVEATSIDAFVEQHPHLAPDVVKVDAEGHEVAVLDGMRATLREHRPALVIELHGTNAAVAQALARAGYAATVLGRREAVEDAPAWAHLVATPPGLSRT